MNWSGETRENEMRKEKPIQGCLRELVSTVGKWNQSPGGAVSEESCDREGQGELCQLALISIDQSLLWECWLPRSCRLVPSCVSTAEVAATGSARTEALCKKLWEGSTAKESATPGHEYCHSNSWSSEVA